jgi:UDP-N-acetylmuramoyl-tripeptide--D-alanyl-D-alanine ligase
MDDPHARLQAARHGGPRVTFGTSRDADLSLESVEDGYSTGTSFTVRYAGTSRTVRLRMNGLHAAWDALAALAAVVASGDADLDAAARGMAELAPGAGRGKVHRLRGDIVLVDDTYNSNPAALASVLETLRATVGAGRKILVMGDMLELGQDEAAFHRAAGERAAGAGVDLLVGVGPRCRSAVEGARRAGIRNARHYESAGDAASALPEIVRPGDLVVVKGSRSMHLEEVVEALRSALGETS